MSDNDRRKSNWQDATELACPHCGNIRDLERRGDEWFCPCCSKCFPALNSQDKRFLKSIHIKGT